MKKHTFFIKEYTFAKEIDEIIALLNKLESNEKVRKCLELIQIIKKESQISKFIHENHDSGIKTALTRALFNLKSITLSEETLCIHSARKHEFSALDSCIDNLMEAYNCLSIFRKHENHNIYTEEHEIFNSDSFYTKKIEEINKEKEELTHAVHAIKKIVETKNDESEKAKKDLACKEQELNESIKLIKKYEAEKLQNEKINDAKKEWNGKIVAAFENLKKYIKPIKNEHRRLGFLFWGYLGISVVIVLCLFIIEYIVCCKIESVNGFPTWETYLSLIAPIPIAMGGLWGFVTLMHRVQRQLVILAKQIHEIEYVEGLLLTTNTLSTNINESMSKVNLAIEKLLENHLNYDGSALTEELLLEKEEKKDAMPYEEVLKLVEKVAGMVSKNKE